MHKADFERLLGRPAVQRSAHFACHYAVADASVPAEPMPAPAQAELSTDRAPAVPESVDKSPGRQILGLVVPKRHARRAVTRSLLKRQMRAAFARHQAALPRGLWLLRLKAGFASPPFVSAASPALRQAVRAELDALMARAASARGRPREVA